jgi:ribosomal protein L40E
MSRSQPTVTELTEECAECGARTPHTVSIELKTESTKQTNRAFSREPYRVTECRACGDTRSQRMNNA